MITNLAHILAGNDSLLQGDGESVFLLGGADNPGSSDNRDWRKVKDKKKRRKILRLSDFNDRQEYAEALARSLAESSVPIQEAENDDLQDEEDALLMALTRVIH